jgi:DNA (cytosine-5)-methyltransferase 1
LLDLYSGAGGAAVGYHRAGFDVVGVDIKRQPRYPFEHHVADALEFLAAHGHEYDAVHASPPCQAYSISTLPNRLTGKQYPDLVAATRTGLVAAGRPWVIENVPGAPVRPDFKLCGCMFGLPRLKRERLFETSWRGFDLRAPCHHPEPVISVCGHDVPSHARKFGGPVSLALRKLAMGIDWMGRDELGLAIPPAYTEFIGEQLLAHLATEAPA